MSAPVYDQRREVLFTKAEVAVLKEAAKRKGLPTATYIRYAVMPVARKDARGEA